MKGIDRSYTAAALENSKQPILPPHQKLSKEEEAYYYGHLSSLSAEHRNILGVRLTAALCARSQARVDHWTRVAAECPEFIELPNGNVVIHPAHTHLMAAERHHVTMMAKAKLLGVNEYYNSLMAAERERAVRESVDGDDPLMAALQ